MCPRIVATVKVPNIHGLQTPVLTVLAVLMVRSTPGRATPSISPVRGRPGGRSRRVDLRHLRFCVNCFYIARNHCSAERRFGINLSF